MARDFVAKRELDLILEAERQAETHIENARIKARNMIDDAAKEAERILTESAGRAEAQALQRVKDARRGGQLAHEEALNEASSEIEHIKSLASQNFERAVQLVIDRIMKAV